jgi:hypothetical protein
VVPPPDTVHFLSDYGIRDEFVGVVHATLHRLAPHVRVIDLTHGVRPFDVRGAGLLLARSVTHLGPGVVLGVVDPGVGSARRGVIVEVREHGGPRWFVGPDNGLLAGAVEVCGGAEQVVELPASPSAESDGIEARWGGPVTFDGRDVFAPAVAELCRGASPADLGLPVDPDSLMRLPAPVSERGILGDGRQCVRAEVVWVDQFGNVKTSVVVDEILATSLPLGTTVEVAVDLAVEPAGEPPVELATGPVQARAVRVFADLADGELGVMADADGHLAIAAAERSAALQLDLGVGDLIELSW